MKSKKVVTCIILVALCLLCACRNVSEKTFEIPAVTGKVNFTILKVGQADAILMETENNNIVIDCGEKDDGEELSELLKEKGISNIDYLFITHFDKDHVGGFPEVAESVTISNILVPDYEGNNDEYDMYLNTVSEKNLTVTTLSEDTVFAADDVLLEVSTPKKQMYPEEDNDFSLVISMTHGENTFLFAGDAEDARLREVISEFGRHHDLLKAPHHGKHSKNTKRFITAIKPTYTVVCDSEKNPGEDETISILEHVGSKIYHTKDGNISVWSDGKEIKISQ